MIPAGFGEAAPPAGRANMIHLFYHLLMSPLPPSGWEDSTAFFCFALSFPSVGGQTGEFSVETSYFSDTAQPILEMGHLPKSLFFCGDKYAMISVRNITVMEA